MNNKDKILFVTTSYEQNNSSAAIRNNGLVKGLISIGYDVTVLTVDWPSSMKSSFFISENKAKVVRTTLNELKVLEYSAKKGQTNKYLSGIRHMIRDIIYFPDICRRWAKKINNININEYSLIISSSDFKSSHYVAKKLKRRNNKLKWIQIWGDPWHTDCGLSRIQKWRIREKEYSLLKASDSVIYVSELTRKYMESCFPDIKNKFHYVPRSYYKEIYKRPIIDDIIRIIYPGILSAGRNISPLLEAIEFVNKDSSLKFELKLYGNYTSDIIKAFQKYEFVSIHPSVEYNEILDLLKVSDVALFLSNNSESTQIPGKLYDYFGTQLPILCIINPGAHSLNKFLGEFDRCKIALNTKSDIIRLLEDICENPKEKYNFNSDFAPDQVAKKVLDSLRIS